ncbi:hypothetical protein [Bacillus sp. 03113]|uniref:hypothetical protein n=1 Tax=Bacillus sp. 03113 TaxID=2578211 RepID=UPI001144A598|nr:hypothetical protein [Bacillus sp. 03113]
MSVWDNDFNRTYAEYHGAPLRSRECDHCGKELISGEKAKIHREYGRLCLDCVDYLREEGMI